MSDTTQDSGAEKSKFHNEETLQSPQLGGFSDYLKGLCMGAYLMGKEKGKLVLLMGATEETVLQWILEYEQLHQRPLWHSATNLPSASSSSSPPAPSAEHLHLPISPNHSVSSSNIAGISLRGSTETAEASLVVGETSGFSMERTEIQIKTESFSALQDVYDLKASSSPPAFLNKVTHVWSDSTDVKSDEKKSTQSLSAVKDVQDHKTKKSKSTALESLRIFLNRSSSVLNDPSEEKKSIPSTVITSGSSEVKTKEKVKSERFSTFQEGQDLKGIKNEATQSVAPSPLANDLSLKVANGNVSPEVTKSNPFNRIAPKSHHTYPHKTRRHHRHQHSSERVVSRRSSTETLEMLLSCSEDIPSSSTSCCSLEPHEKRLKDLSPPSTVQLVHPPAPLRSMSFPSADGTSSSSTEYNEHWMKVMFPAVTEKDTPSTSLPMQSVPLLIDEFGRVRYFVLMHP